MKIDTTITTIVLSVVVGMSSGLLDPCPGDTRGDRRCNHDPTHRVCAKIGLAGSTFWEFTGQRSWCNTVGYYGGPYGSLPRCPADKPTWCICKWATARWIKNEGCGESVEFDCAATDVCNLKASYHDYNVDLQPAHDCMMIKCPDEWNRCPEASNDKMTATSGAASIP